MSASLAQTSGHTHFIAECGDDHAHVVFRAAPPLELHHEPLWRTDGNSPVQVGNGGATAFYSTYEPRGRTFRRLGTCGLEFRQPPIPVRLLDDPDPSVGKWIEAVWCDVPSGTLHGWYHAEEPVVGTRLHVPHIGELASADGGLTWSCRGEVLRAPAAEIDPSWRSGAFAGGYGDLSAVADRTGHFVYLAFTSYRAAEAAQGIALARLPRPRTGAPAAGLELWTSRGWQADPQAEPQPLWPQARGWRHADPDGFWGPAVHYNRVLRAYAMLLTRTAGGHGDLVTEGIYLSTNPDLADPAGWTTPLKIVRSGGWFPQVIGTTPGSGDAEIVDDARFFMAGFSAWSIEIRGPDRARAADRPLAPTAQDFAGLFGAGRRCPW